MNHSRIVRATHWINAIAFLIMVGSGWRIYNNEPIFPFRFPIWATLGGDPFVSLASSNDPGTANAIAWHFAAMWVLGINFAVMFINGLATWHYPRDLLPLTPRMLIRDVVAALTFKLDHHARHYNAVQKAFYLFVLVALAGMIASGLAIWKPVQLALLTALFGGFQGARLVHFLLMAGLVGFLVVHLSLVALVPSTLRNMTVGKRT
jgi:thiosulfate reductase cytochrome b subunit